MITDAGLRRTLDELMLSGKCSSNNEAVLYFIGRKKIMNEQTVNGSKILKKIRLGEFTPKNFRQISDKDFETIVFDLNISDRETAEIFDVSIGVVARRRNKLGIPRNNHTDAYQTYRWAMCDRMPPELDDFLPNIAD